MASPDGTRRYEVDAVRYGTLRSRKADLFNRHGSYGEPDVEVDTHIEPLEPELPLGTDATPARIETISAALSRFAADTAIHDIHNVRVCDTDAGEIVNFHCRAAPSMSVWPWRSRRWDGC